MQQTLSARSLIKHIFIAILLAATVLITVILPAEYNIDPTGVGEQLGLTKLAPENQITIVAASTNTAVQAKDEITVIVPPKRGVEFKFSMNQYDKMTYKWHSDDGAIYHDLHGEPKGDTTGYFESYTITTAAKMEGSFTAPFTGSHGWYWKNTTDNPITISLTTSGQYQVQGLKQ
jgi:hypothetical protein